jgi:hypothetical protein
LISGDDSKGGEEVTPDARSVLWLSCGLAVTVSRLCKKAAKIVAESGVGKVRINLRFCCSIIGHLTLLYLRRKLTI